LDASCHKPGFWTVLRHLVGLGNLGWQKELSRVEKFMRSESTKEAFGLFSISLNMARVGDDGEIDIGCQYPNKALCTQE
jgi:hypothetical protein